VFFSSRRRHTRSTRDWSSDVCSSDLGTIMHWRAGAEGRGALLTGDVAMVAMDRRSLSFMYSFPNYIPLNAEAVRRIWAAVEPLRSEERRVGKEDRTCRFTKDVEK